MSNRLACQMLDNTSSYTWHNSTAKAKQSRRETSRSSQSNSYWFPITLKASRHNCSFLLQQMSACLEKEQQPPAGLKWLLNQVNGLLKQVLKQQMSSDPTFAAQLAYSIDIRVQEFLKDCKQASDRSDVDKRVVNFSDIVNDIRFQRFGMPLPPCFVSTSTNESENININGRGGDGSRDRKRPRGVGGDGDQGRQIC